MECKIKKKKKDLVKPSIGCGERDVGKQKERAKQNCVKENFT